MPHHPHFARVLASSMAAKSIWRPEGAESAHIAEFGLPRDAFQLRRVDSGTPDWRDGALSSQAAALRGETRLPSLWVQDAWRFAPTWRAVLGGRWEHWQAGHGRRSLGTPSTGCADRGESFFSPMAALSRDALYAQTTATGTAVNNVELIRTDSFEIALQTAGLGLCGLEFNASLTSAESRIVRNAANPASVGKLPPRVPEWHAHLLASYTVDERWSGSFGIDNLGNRTYRASHPYPQRTAHAGLRWDL